MKSSTLVGVAGIGALLFAVAVGAYEWYASQPPKFEIAIRMPENVESGSPYQVPIVIDNGTRWRLRIVGWTSC